jgi:hypothetical protein
MPCRTVFAMGVMGGCDPPYLKVYNLRYINACGLSIDTTPGSEAVDSTGTLPSGIPNCSCTDMGPCADTGVQCTWAQDPGSWGDAGFGIRTYDLLRDGVPIATGLSYGITSYIDTTGSNTVLYTYAVRYNNGCGLSAITSPGSQAGDLIGSPPSGFSNNTASDVDACADTGVQYSWSDPANWGDNGSGNRFVQALRDGTLICTSPPGPCGLDTTGTNNQMYLYQIRYMNGCGITADTAGVQAADTIDMIPCPNVGNTLHIVKSGINAVLSWNAVTCADFANYRVYGSTSYNNPFPSGWLIVGNPVPASLSDPLASAYIAYKTLSVDSCGNLSPN